MSKSIYERRGNIRIYAGFMACLIVLLIKSVGIEIPDIVMGIVALGLVPYIIVNAYIIEYQNKKHNYVD